MNEQLLRDLAALRDEDLRLLRCQVDVSFPPGLKIGNRPHCLWFTEFGGRPQIVEVADTGWETYHFSSLQDAQRFAAATRQHIAAGSFAEVRLPTSAEVLVQVRATVEVASDG